MSGPERTVTNPEEALPETVNLRLSASRGVPAPRRLSHFVLLEQLGQGGMGVVFSAFDEKLERKVAIKLVRPQAPGSSSAFQERLLREAQALARLSHPHVVAVYEVGVLDEGDVFIAMEFVKGESLRGWQKDPKRTWREVLGAYVSAGLGLAAAHKAGVVHRDFKPDNVLVGDDGRVRVVDFGLALATEAPAAPPEPGAAEAGPAFSLATGAFAGTPGYMAPEQLGGATVDARTDQFSFCVALHEALYGERPFTTLLGESKPPPTRRARPKELKARWLWEALERGLSLEPSARFPSMDALLRELTRDHGRTRRRAAWAGGALAGVLASGAGVVQLRAEPPCQVAPSELSGSWDSAQRERVRSAILGTKLPYAEAVATGVDATLERYATRWLQARRAACEATHVHHTQSADLLDRRMECLASRKNSLQATAEVFVTSPVQAAERSSTLLDGLGGLELCADPALLRLGLPPPPDAQTAAETEQVRRELARGSALIAAGDLKGAATQVSAIEQRAANLRYPPLKAEVLRAKGALQLAQGELARGVATLQDALQAATEHRHDELLADAWLTLAREAGARHQPLDEARAWVRQADAWLRRLHPSGDLRSIEVEFARGNVQAAGGQHREAVETYGRALAEASARQVEELRLVPLLRGRAIALAALGQGQEALADSQRALAITRAAWGDEHPDVALTRRALGVLQVERLGAVDEGARELKEALRIFSASHGEDSVQAGECEQALSEADLFRGDYTLALAHAERAEAIFARRLGPTHRNRGEALTAMGVLRFMKKDYAGSLAAYQQARGILEAALGTEHADVGLLLSNIGETLLALGDAEAALQHFERALAVLRKSWGPDHPNLATPLKGLGLACLERKRYELALDALEQSLKLRDAAGPGDPQELAETRWALARTLGALGGQPERRRELATRALETYRTLGPEWAGRVRDISRTLASAAPSGG